MTTRYNQYLALTAIDAICKRVDEDLRQSTLSINHDGTLDVGVYTPQGMGSFYKGDGDTDARIKFLEVVPDAVYVDRYSESPAYTFERHGVKIEVWFMYAKKPTALVAIPLDEEL